MRYFKIPLQPTRFWAYMISYWWWEKFDSWVLVTLWKKLYFMQLLSGHAIYESDGSFFNFLLLSWCLPYFLSSFGHNIDLGAKGSLEFMLVHWIVLCFVHGISIMIIWWWLLKCIFHSRYWSIFLSWPLSLEGKTKKKQELGLWLTKSRRQRNDRLDSKSN